MSRSFRRGQIEAKDVLKPFLVLMALNIAILSTWTAVAPLEWTRVETSSIDRFGRSTESYGTCWQLGETSQYVLFSLLIAVNFTPLLFATYQTYESRTLPPTHYNESYFIRISLASLLEAFLLSVPLFFVVSDDPSARFIVESVLVTIICLAILLPIFVPKYVSRNEAAQSHRVSRKVSLAIADGWVNGWLGPSIKGLKASRLLRRNSKEFSTRQGSEELS